MQYSCSSLASCPFPAIPSSRPAIYQPSMAATTSTPRRTIETCHRTHRGSNEANMGIPFHGSCSRCHHFHKNYLFTFSLSSTVHTRLFCERCKHPMFGLGRVSTQNTLASVESGSVFTPAACVDQPGPQSALQGEAVPGTPELGLLTTIAERRYLATSRSTSHIGTSAPTLAASPTGEESVESRLLPMDIAQGGPEEQALSPQTATLRCLRTIGRRFKQRFRAKIREWNLSRKGLHIARTTESPYDAPGPSAAASPGPIVSGAHRTASAGDVSAFASASTTKTPSGQRRSNEAGELVEGTEGDTDDRHAPLRARRRALTLARKRESASIRKCECSPECLCISGSQVVQVDRADTTENIHVPRYLFPYHHSSTESSHSQPSQNGAQGLELLHIGGHFDSPPSSAAEGGRRWIRLSQGSTPWSNGSSISLHARRPPVGRASSMPVGTHAHHFAGVRTGLHANSSVLASDSPGTARAPNSPDEGSLSGRISRAESSRNDEVPSHENATSFAYFPGSQEEEQLVEGVSPVSHTPTRNDNEVIPTPRSGIQFNGGSDGAMPVGSDGLSSALQDLVNGEIADHEGHSPEL